MSKRAFLVPVALTVAALLGTPTVSTASLPPSEIASTVTAKGFTPNGDLVLERAGDSTVKMAQHDSHSSHESHASHESHSSHVSGGY